MDASLHVLLGRALGVLEAQPEGPPPANYSRRAYERYARRGLDGFAGWQVPPQVAGRLVRAGIRMAALDRLQSGARELGEALAGGDGAGADRAADEAREALEMLRSVPLRRRGPTASRDGGS